uniref:7TM_GPCR_Srx domain-containing protein n=1 Tax=Haemonchus placei TaxID=6290 RepID=A0A0N4X347_HAEPC
LKCSTKYNSSVISIAVVDVFVDKVCFRIVYARFLWLVFTGMLEVSLLSMYLFVDKLYSNLLIRFGWHVLHRRSSRISQWVGISYQVSIVDDRELIDKDIWNEGEAGAAPMIEWIAYIDILCLHWCQ